MNYYVDEKGLAIREKNIFTAIEIVTAKPLRGELVFNQFLESNKWVAGFLPNYNKERKTCKRNFRNAVKAITEFLLNNKFGDRLNTWLMKFTVNRWNRKTRLKKRYKNGMIKGMDAGLHYSKPMPQQVQEKVLNKYQMNIEKALGRLKSTLPASAI